MIWFWQKLSIGPQLRVQIFLHFDDWGDILFDDNSNIKALFLKLKSVHCITHCAPLPWPNFARVSLSLSFFDCSQKNSNTTQQQHNYYCTTTTTTLVGVLASFALPPPRASDRLVNALYEPSSAWRLTLTIFLPSKVVTSLTMSRGSSCSFRVS